MLPLSASVCPCPTPTSPPTSPHSRPCRSRRRASSPAHVSPAAPLPGTRPPPCCLGFPPCCSGIALSRRSPAPPSALALAGAPQHHQSRGTGQGPASGVGVAAQTDRRHGPAAPRIPSTCSLALRLPAPPPYVRTSISRRRSPIALRPVYSPSQAASVSSPAPCHDTAPRAYQRAPRWPLAWRRRPLARSHRSRIAMSMLRAASIPPASTPP